MSNTQLRLLNRGGFNNPIVLVMFTAGMELNYGTSNQPFFSAHQVLHKLVVDLIYFSLLKCSATSALPSRPLALNKSCLEKTRGFTPFLTLIWFPITYIRRLVCWKNADTRSSEALTT